MIKDPELCLLRAANREEYPISESLSAYFEGDVDQSRVKVYFSMIPDRSRLLWWDHKENDDNKNTYICKYNGMLSEVDKALKKLLLLALLLFSPN